ncbi:energy-coupling factor transporter ATPase [Lactobacillus sp. S2-2]|uniref:energy-coupling factor transporter ATPase n=1 Tax=Lactobacillus sp. S2-2 TaxID=2692917 RepID=UPI001EFFC2C2|nr:energy-coupling factor transporter ATPase [Lactobacillus sp. S2-2]MCF6514794.1 energy-coupling factor transporter ATPase [Lactobacillus sp. S2-2]
MDKSIKIKHLDYVYQRNTPFEKKALDNISVEIPKEEITMIIGKTGSGKSTFIKHLNGLLIPSEGSLEISDLTVNSDVNKKVLTVLRKKVGLVFQFPEKQLFEETVIKDVMVGPKNFGLSDSESLSNAREYLTKVGIGSDLYNKSPFEISGGQMRRVAIAGVLAMNPEILVLDEPTAGLDSIGRKMIMKLLRDLNKDNKITIIMVTHDINVVSEYSDNVIYFKENKIAKYGPTRDILYDENIYSLNSGLIKPDVVNFFNKLDKTKLKIQNKPITTDELIKVINENIDRS